MSGRGGVIVTGKNGIDVLLRAGASTANQENKGEANVRASNEDMFFTEEPPPC